MRGQYKETDCNTCRKVTGPVTLYAELLYLDIATGKEGWSLWFHYLRLGIWVGGVPVFVKGMGPEWLREEHGNHGKGGERLDIRGHRNCKRE